VEIKCSKLRQQTKSININAVDKFDDFHVAKTFLSTAMAISGEGGEPRR
jgi:hypothetical protein